MLCSWRHGREKKKKKKPKSSVANESIKKRPEIIFNLKTKEILVYGARWIDFPEIYPM